MSITLHSEPTGPLIVSQALCYKISTSVPATGISRTLRWKLQRDGGLDVTEWASIPGTDGSIILVNPMKDAASTLQTTLPTGWDVGSGVYNDADASDKFRLDIAEVDVDKTVDPCTSVVVDTAQSSYVDVINAFFYIDQEFDLTVPTWLSARADKYNSCHGIIHMISVWLPTGDWQVQLYADVKTSPDTFTYSITSTGGVYHIIAHPDTWTQFEDASFLRITILDGAGNPYSGISRKEITLNDCCFDDEILTIVFLEPQGGFASMVFDERMSRAYTRNKLLTCSPQSCDTSFSAYAEASDFTQTPSNERGADTWRKIVRSEGDELWMRALLASNQHWLLRRKRNGDYYLTSIYIRNGEFVYAKKDALTKLEITFEYSKEFVSV